MSVIVSPAGTECDVPDRMIATLLRKGWREPRVSSAPARTKASEVSESTKGTETAEAVEAVEAQPGGGQPDEADSIGGIDFAKEPKAPARRK